MEKEKVIYVFADFLPFNNELIGRIYVSQTRGKEFYSFEYDQKWLKNENMMLDPDLQLYKGRQYINDDKNIFGVFADSCPDRWGQRLMKRREEIRAKKADEKPDIYGEYLSLNVDADNSSIDFDLALGAAPYYGLEETQAAQLVESIKSIVRNNWEILAKKYDIRRGEMDRMRTAFRACEK